MGKLFVICDRRTFDCYRCLISGSKEQTLSSVQNPCWLMLQKIVLSGISGTITMNHIPIGMMKQQRPVHVWGHQRLRTNQLMFDQIMLNPPFSLVKFTKHSAFRAVTNSRDDTSVKHPADPGKLAIMLRRMTEVSDSWRAGGGVCFVF